MMASSRATAATGAPSGASCAPQNLTQPCTCANSWPGGQTCSAGAWTPCSCRAPSGGAGSGAVANPGDTSAAAGVDPVGNSSPTRFDWQRTVESLGSCEAGHYEGTFGGIYGPSIIVVSDLKVIVDAESLKYVDGTEIDFVRQGLNEAFKFRNPNVKGECGCGESFNV